MNDKRSWCAASILCLAALLAGCQDKPAAPLAPTATALTPTKPAAAGAVKFAIDKPSSKIDFTLDAPIEKMRGRIHGTSEGDLAIDLADLTKTTGLLVGDIGSIELFQQVAKNGEFGEETKSEAQNDHLKNWLQISADADEDVRKKNSRLEFSIKSIESASATDVSKMTGAERKVTLQAKGDLLFHGHKAEKVAELEATFTYEDDKPTKIHVKTVKPFGVGLEEYDIKPRRKWNEELPFSDQLRSKVGKEAEVSLEFTASAH